MLQLLLVILMTCAVPAWATTYHVGKTGSDSTSCAATQSQSTPRLTINAGIACLAGGDTLTIHAGTYAEGNLGVSPLIPAGTASGRTTIQAATGEAVILKPNNIAIDCVILIRPSLKYVTFDYLILDGSAANGTTVLSAFGVCGDSEITGATLPNNLLFQRGRIHHMRSQGILLRGTAITVQYTEIDHVGDPADPSTFRHGVYWSVINSFFNYNNVHHNQCWGLQNFGGGDGNNGNSFLGNIFATNGCGGITLASGNNLTLINNLVYDNANCGICTPASTGTTMYNNTITNNHDEGGIVLCCGASAATASTVLRNNIVYNNVGGNLVGVAGATQSNNLTSDPLFVNPSLPDYHLQAASPALNAGMTLAAVLLDKDGVTRPQGSSYDIGAYEGIGGGAPPMPPLPAPFNLRLIP